MRGPDGRRRLREGVVGHDHVEHAAITKGRLRVSTKPLLLFSNAGQTENEPDVGELRPADLPIEHARRAFAREAPKLRLVLVLIVIVIVAALDASRLPAETDVSRRVIQGDVVLVVRLEDRLAGRLVNRGRRREASVNRARSLAKISAGWSLLLATRAI